MKPFTPEYHQGYGPGCYYAIPGRRAGTSKLSEPRMGERCWTVYREALCLNMVFDTYEEANDAAAELATDEISNAAVQRQAGNQPRSTFGHLAGRIEGYLEDDEEAA